MVELVRSGLEGLRESCAGRVVTPRDAGYEVMRKVWNGAVDRRPGVIVRCAGPEDVEAAISFARQEDLEISVRGGGHGFGGTAVTDGGVMLDLGALRTIDVDAASRWASCGAGATWADLDAATQVYGLATPGGTISHTGIAGLTLGGGFGWLSREHGLTADNLESADVVLADGRQVHASAREHDDLFWALRGGGGNFGVVTAFAFRLHPVGPRVRVTLLFWEAERGHEAVAAIDRAVTTLPGRVSALIAFGMSAPVAPYVPEEHRARPGHLLVLAGFGPPEEHASVVAALEDTTPPLFSHTASMPYPRLQSLLDESTPWGVAAYEKALDLPSLGPDAIATLCEQAALKGSPMSFLPAFRLDGAFSAVPDEATAFGGGREPHYTMSIVALAPTPEALEAERAWVRDAWSAMLPHARGTGTYVNFIADQDEDRVRASYGRKYARLAAIKAEYDPDNVFHLNANIEPAG
ncbi:FAD-binding oxidoreductase [Nonomuraea sp. MCN248]|uniref:FAD-binding oxidoreductase n=1 Tax=Nonomuraea corallina TaxID=2989783 RepID=A0ABT4SIF4_9ACTN|nr:FAD-binding oxidoreductase [Nonomuraea corallina]MDA0636982.1 FAD-binding oxidoreductase [Nonomuraea corallina]